jgi:hypothetical protein
MSVVSCLGSGLLPPAVPIVAPSATGYIKNLYLSAPHTLADDTPYDAIIAVLPVGVWQASSSIVVRDTAGTISSYTAELVHPYFTANGGSPISASSALAVGKISANLSGVFVSDGVSACKLSIIVRTSDGSPTTVSGTETSMQFVKIA